MRQTCKIERVDNGFIFSYFDSDPEDVPIEAVILFEINDKVGDDMAEKSALRELFLFIAEHFGVHHDSYSATNLNITFDKKGRKVADEG